VIDMLVLNRRLGEKVSIGAGLVTVTVLEVGCGRVKLGFDGAPELPIHREEVALRIAKEREQANGQATA